MISVPLCSIDGRTSTGLGGLSIVLNQSCALWQMIYAQERSSAALGGSLADAGSKSVLEGLSGVAVLASPAPRVKGGWAKVNGEL